jgi:hypothetical protein
VVPQECTAAQFDTVQAVAFGVRQGIVFSVDDACLPIEGLRSRKLIFWGVPAANQQSYRDFVAAWYPAPEIPTVIEFREFSGPPSTRPTIQFSGQPLTIVAGQSSQLDWVVMNANSVKLGGEVVTAQGSRTVKPASTTIYALTATGAGGTAQSNVMITVTPVTPPPPPVSKTVFTVTVLAGGPLAAVAAGTHEVLTKKAQSAISALEELSPARGPGVLRDVAIGNYAQAMFEAQGLAQSQGALSIGLPGVCIKFNPAQAKDLVPRFPGRLVIVEPYMVGGETSIGYWMDRTELGSLPPGTVVTGCNEEDHGHPSGTPRGIQTRSEFDYAAWGECKKRGLIYAGGGWALGGPNVVDPAIVQAMRNYYAPLVNGGMWLNQHSYMGKDGSTTDQPLMGRFAHKYPVTLGGKTFTISQAWWTALRLKFYTAICGMDPRKANFIATEGGIEGDDKMSPALISGGFNANQNVDMVAYLKAVRAAFDEPWWFGDTNTWHTSPLRAYCVFCANSPNEHDKWYGYDISQRIGQLLLV